MPSRRVFLGSLAAISFSGCLDVGDRFGNRATAETASSPQTLVSTPPERVPAGATVGLLPAAASSLRTVADDLPTTVDGDWRVPVVAFDCFTFDGGTFALDAESRGGGYRDDFDVREVAEPTNRTIVSVSSLPEDERDAVVEAIATGSYTFDSREGGYRPSDEAIAYDDRYYVFEQTLHADHPVVQVFVLDRADAGDCVTLSVLSLDEADRAALEAVRDADGDATVPATTARALRESGHDFVVVGRVCYEVPAADREKLRAPDPKVAGSSFLTRVVHANRRATSSLASAVTTNATAAAGNEVRDARATR